eukprot:364241-Chlamydomonas_euryale.AAC.10
MQAVFFKPPPSTKFDAVDQGLLLCATFDAVDQGLLLHSCRVPLQTGVKPPGSRPFVADRHWLLGRVRLLRTDIGCSVE